MNNGQHGVQLHPDIIELFFMLCSDDVVFQTFLHACGPTTWAESVSNQSINQSIENKKYENTMIVLI